MIEGRPARSLMRPPLPAPESPFVTKIAGLGIVEPASETISLATAQGGVVRELYVIDGDNVAANQPLFALDNRDYKAALAGAEATVAARKGAVETIERQIQSQQAVIAQHQASLDGARVQRKMAMLTRDRDAILLRNQLIPHQLFDTVAANEEAAQATVAAETASLIAAQRYSDVLAAEQTAANAEVAVAEAACQRAAIALDKTVVRTPIGGTVLKVNIHPGEYAEPGVLATPLLTLGTLDKLHLRVEIDQEDAWRIVPGTQAVAMVRGNPGVRTSLHFLRFEPSVVPKRNLSGSDDRIDTRVLEIIYSFDPARFPVRVGQEVDVFIGTDQPSAAAYQADDQSESARNP